MVLYNFIAQAYENIGVKYNTGLQLSVVEALMNLKDNYYLTGSCLYYLLGFTKKHIVDVDVYMVGEEDVVVENYDNNNKAINNEMYLQNISFQDYGTFKGLSLKSATHSTFASKYKKREVTTFKGKRTELYLLELAGSLSEHGYQQLLTPFITKEEIDIEEDIKNKNYYNITQYIMRHGITEELKELI